MEQGNKYVEQASLACSSAVDLTANDVQTPTDSIPTGLVLFARDRELTLLFATDGFYRICGYSKPDLAGKTGAEILSLLLTQEDRERAYKRIAEQPYDEFPIKLLFQDKSGMSRWARLQVHPQPSTITVDTILCTFTDISTEVSLQRELEQQQERYRIITEQFHDIFFEYNLINDTMYASSQWEEIFGYQAQGVNIWSAVLSGEYVYDDDKELVEKIFERSTLGLPTDGLEIRMRRAGGGYLWASISTVIIFDSDGVPYKVVGKIVDIDEKKRELEKLITTSQHEPLTGLYNKAAVESSIRACLRASDAGARHALMIIDVDDFKGVNDNLGHLFGDSVLSEISAKMRTLFRSTDILGRFGGDEFIIFLKNIGDDRQIAQKASAVCDIFHETYTGEKKDYKISGSVGISIYPEHGNNFYELFEHADAALYEAKKHGKDGFVISGHSADFSFHNDSAASVDTGSFSPRSGVLKSVISDVCEIFSEKSNSHRAVQYILKLIGQEFLANRVFILEKGKDFKKTFEWHAEGIKSIKNPTLYTDFSYALDSFQQEGFYYCQDVAVAEKPNNFFEAIARSGTRRLFLCPIYQSGEIVAVMGLEGSALPWCLDERHTILDICIITGSFLLKFRQSEIMQKELECLITVGQNLGLWYYMVEPGTWRLLYMNSVVSQAVPSVKTGEYCYQALRNRSSVCENCPANQIDKTFSAAEADIFDEQRDRWFHTSASITDWSGSRAVLLCCNDITQYHKE